MASGVISEIRRHPKAGRKNFSALRFSIWVFSARNGGLERLSRNQSAHSLKVKLLLDRTIGNLPSSRSSSRFLKARSACWRSVSPVDSFLIVPVASRYRIHQSADLDRW